jgi:CBS domain containing-hemolysin-like protein
VRKEASAGGRSARLIESLLSNKQRFLATTLFGTLISVVVSTVVMTLALHQHHPKHAELWLIFALTPSVVILGEIVPKTLGRQYADWMAKKLVYVIWLAAIVFTPFAWVFVRFSSWVLRGFGIKERKLVTREELEAALQAPSAQGQGAITEGERKMISNIFGFGERRVEDVMVPLSDVVALADATTLEAAAKEIEDKQYTRFPVFQERVDRVVGTIHAFDLLKAGPTHSKVGDLARAPIFAPTSQPAVDLLLELQRARQGMAIVVDEYGGAIGVATIEDILEEVVGEIDDEHDIEPVAIRKEADGVYRTNARTSVTEINRELKTDLPESEEYESVGGLIVDQLKHIPREGESVRVGQVLIKVTKASERAVEEVQLRVGRKRQ